MISPQLRQAVVAARAAIPLEREWRMMNRIPGGTSRAVVHDAKSLGEFLERYALGPEYLAFSGSEEADQWWRLLKHIGRV
jgi:hypothetical protein